MTGGATLVHGVRIDRRTWVRHPLWALAVASGRGLRAVSPPAVAAALHTVVQEMKLAMLHRDEYRRAARRYRGVRGLRINIGCGTNTKAGWVNIDMHPVADVRLDARRPLPFDDAACAAVYSEHVYEHLAYPGEAEAFLAECHRVLAPGGTISIGVPDTAWPLGDYVHGRDDYFAWCRMQPWYPAWNRTRLDQVNFHFRQQLPVFGLHHQYAYDLETLADRLATAGFEDVRRREFDPSRDSPDRRRGTLYVDARRGGTAAHTQEVA